MEDAYYQFLVELIQIVQLIFSPVIKIDSIHYLKQAIEDHLCTFGKLFPQYNITPKQHYLIHLPSTIQMLGPMVRSSCFSFESAHKYFKELARKQNFKNLPLSLARRNQYNECCSFGDPNENGNLHPLFSSEKTCGVTKKVDVESCQNLRVKFNASCILPGIELSNVFSASWIKLYGTKYKKTAIIAVDARGNPIQPLFGEICCIWVVNNYVYFEVYLLTTISFDFNHQAYQVSSRNSERENSIVYSYESLVDYNVFHIKKDSNGTLYVPVKYDLDDIMEEHVYERNPLNV